MGVRSAKTADADGGGARGKPAALGTVYLVGAGPGHPGLLTLRGKRLLERADAVVHDLLANRVFLDLAPAGAERIYVGKSGERGHTMEQAQINELLVSLARRHRTVVRLKGGDPFVFGRGGEEMLHLRAAGVPCEVVPGVTSAISAPAFAGIPVTDRAPATSVTIVTGNEDPTDCDSCVDWAGLASTPGTLVCLMCVKRLGEITAALIRGGRSPISRRNRARRHHAATAGGHRHARGHRDARAPGGGATAGRLRRGRRRAAAREPGWFEARPLFGARSSSSAAWSCGPLHAALETRRGLDLPMLRLAPPVDRQAAVPSTRSARPTGSC